MLWNIIQNMRLVPALLVLSFMMSGPIFADTPDEYFHRVNTARNARDLSAAIDGLKRFKKEYPEEFLTNDLDYLLARLLEDTHDRAEAMAVYAEIHSRRSQLGDHAIWRMSQIARYSGNFLLERMYLAELEAFYPDSILISAADRRNVQSLFDSGDNLSVIATVSRPPASSSLAARSYSYKGLRYDRLLLGYARLYNGDNAEARAIFEETIERTQDPQQPDGLALEAVRGLDVLDDRSSLSDTEHKRRAWIYQYNRDFNAARQHYRSIVNDHHSSDAVAEALFQLGRGYFQDNGYSESVLWFERLIEQYPESELVKPGLLQLAGAYSRSGRHRESISRYHTYVDRYPDDARLDRAYLNPIDTLRDQNADSEALRRSALVQEVFRGKVGEAQGLFSEARIYLSLEKWDKALESLTKLNSLSDLGGSRVPGGTTREEVSFLVGVCQEMMQMFPEAIETYLAIPDGRESYYGGRSTERLLALAESERAKPWVAEKRGRIRISMANADPDTKRKAVQALLRLTNSETERAELVATLKTLYAALPSYSKLPELPTYESGDIPLLEAKERKLRQRDIRAARAEILLRLGLSDEAAVELEASRSDENRSRLAAIYTDGDRAYRGISVAESLWRDVPQDLHIELMPVSAVKLLYPTPYRDKLVAHSSAANVDPRFLLAIMRQESRYRPDAVSSAAARGLMQFISPTAIRMANANRIEDFRDGYLFDPGTSILFGATYTGEMFKLFINQPAAVAAGYNGGEENMQRWMKRSRSDSADRFVPEIQYAQTKDYVYKVMANYRVYTTFYDEQLRLKPQFSDRAEN